LDALERAKPIFKELPGWKEDITGVKRMEDLPDNARNYLEEIERLTGVSVSIFSVGPDRNQTNLLKDFWD
jgi:adenylosuccinate synthase